jgi:hypothetical protein
MEPVEKILELLNTLNEQNANRFEQILGMLHAQNAMLNAAMHALPNRPDLLANLSTAHNTTIKSLRDSNQSSTLVGGAETVFNAALVSLMPGGMSDKDRLAGIVDQMAASRNGVLVLINLLATQPGIDPDLLVDELEEASSVPNVMLNLPTVTLLEQMLEIVKRRNSDTQAS